MKLVYIDSCSTVELDDIVRIFKRPCKVSYVPQNNTEWPRVTRTDDPQATTFEANPTWFGACWYVFKQEKTA
jgi:hypothetical protein